MFPEFSVSFNPIVPWPILIGIIGSVTFLTLWAYRRRLHGTSGAWRWVALSLRLLAILLCLLAALRPSVALKEKQKQQGTIVFLVDRSTSMTVSDEVNNRSRWSVAAETIERAREEARKLGPNIDYRIYAFDSAVAEPKESELTAKNEPKGKTSAAGAALLEVLKRNENSGRKLTRIVMISDYANNSGVNPLTAARQMKQKGVPVVTIPLGTENAKTGARDVSLREIIAGPTVFVKNELEVKGTLVARGFANQTLEVELLVEDDPTPVARAKVKVPDTTNIVPISGIKYIPKSPGEKKLTLKVAPQEGEVLPANNQISTFVTVLSGGLNVKFLQGSNWSWDYKFMMLSLMTSQDIHVDAEIIKRAAEGNKGEVSDEEFAPGKYNAYVLSDLPANYLTTRQQRLLAEAVRKGAGLMMLGGHSSFGDGGWGETPLADILPVQVHLGDGQYEPEGGVKFVPNTMGLDNFLLQVGSNRTDNQRIWDAMRPIAGTNLFGEVKQSAKILAETPAPNPMPLLVSMDVGQGRSIAYGGDTWVWYRSGEEGRLAHRKFWRQVVFWLAHKENEGDNKVKVTLDNRRIAVGETIDLTATAHDAKGSAIPNVRFEARIEREKAAPPVIVPLDVYNKGDEGKGLIQAIEKIGEPGNYSVTVTAKRDNEEIGHDSARFLVYQDDRELENPSADLNLAREIARITEGESVAHEGLATYLKGLDRSGYTDYVTTREHLVWDNWPFLLIFTAVLTLEWWLRKRNGWV
ncbi:MAG: glutamine amidotransferase [Isosphaeraceae bacterium]